MSAWYVVAFRRDYLQRYAHRDDGLGRLEAAFARKALQVRPGARVLDLCCGGGRHSRALAREGLHITGVDLSEELLHEAIRLSKGLPVEYVRADMRTIPLQSGTLDGAVSLFTSFGYFCEEAEDIRVLLEVARVLKPGARYLFDFFNRAVTLRDLQRESIRFANGCALLERRWYDAKRGRLNKLVLSANRTVRRHAILETVRAYSPAKLQSMLERAGFHIVSRHGGLDGSAFNACVSPRCVLVAEKTG